MLEYLFQALHEIFQWYNLLSLCGGVILGVFMGSVPGLTATMAIALIIPLTFNFPPVTAIIMLLGAYKGGCYGGSIPAILISAPGTPAAVMTVLDGYELAKQGKARKALKMALYSSVFGDTFSDIVLIIVALPLVAIALKFGPAEYSMLLLLALTTVAGVAGRSMVKGLIAACFGILIAMAGMDPITGSLRFAFGCASLYEGFNLIPLLVGLLAVAEIFNQMGIILTGQKSAHIPMATKPEDNRLSWAEFRPNLRTLVKSSVIGTFVGALPGIGPTVGAALSYREAKRSSKNPDMFGKGSLEGVAASEAGNNAVSGANLIPLLTLGIPGDVAAAVISGAFMIQGLLPGPSLIPQNPDIIYSLFVGLILANFILLFVGNLYLKSAVRVASLPPKYLFPVVLMFCVVGSYAIRQDVFDIWVMAAAGFLGYLMQKFDFSRVAFLIGVILGPITEGALRRAFIVSDGSFAIFVTRPIALVFLILTVLTVISIVYRELKQRKSD